MAKIMIVDDSGLIRAILKKYVEKAGHEVVFQAATGLEAVEGYTSTKPDLVTMDISMPELGGISAVKKILEFDPKAKIIIVSGIDQKETVYKAVEAGAVRYMTKPVNEQKFFSVIEDLLK